MEELNKSEVARLRQDKLYLYFTQLGKDMYSGEPIDIEELSSQKYDIDHIYPQSLIKDDSLNNRVLVSKESNANKLDVYPIDPPIRNKMIPFWRMLKTKGIISVEKYNRLTRSEGLSAEEIASFVNKQIVSTSQATKAVINLLSHEYPKAKMVWAKASHVSDFRRDNNMYKSREANDYHHAKDAYLNVVVGNVFDTKYTVNSAIAIAKMKISETKFSINPDRIYNSDIPGAWSIDSGSKSIDIVRKYMNYNNVLFTVMPTMKKGQLFDQNILPKGKSDVLIPLKENSKMGNTQKYGGYNKLGIAYYFLVESLNKKGKPQRSIESMPIMYYKKFEEDPSFAQHLLTDYFKLKSPKILVSKILVNSPIKRKNTMCRITGKSGLQLLLARNIQWNVDQETLNYLHLLEKYRDRQKKKKTFDAKHPEDKNLEELEINSLYSQNSKSNVKPQIISKKANIELYEKVQNQLNKEIYNGISLDSPKTTVRDGKEKFIALDVKSQVIIIFEILKLLSCGSEHSNLVLIDGPANSGSLLMSKNISNDEDLEIINQSITGVYESVRFSNLEVK
jgi:CRISPR-associated endonuclease Csn1